VGVAAQQSGLIPADGAVTALVISGGNIDRENLQRVLADGV
jgi:threonine dehydratase